MTAVRIEIAERAPMDWLPQILIDTLETILWFELSACDSKRGAVVSARSWVSGYFEASPESIEDADITTEIIEIEPAHETIYSAIMARYQDTADSKDVAKGAMSLAAIDLGLSGRQAMLARIGSIKRGSISARVFLEMCSFLDLRPGIIVGRWQEEIKEGMGAFFEAALIRDAAALGKECKLTRTNKIAIRGFGDGGGRASVLSSSCARLGIRFVLTATPR